MWRGTCYFGDDFGCCFGQFRPFCGRGAVLWYGKTPLEPEKYLWTFNEKRVVNYQCNSCRATCQSRKCFLGWFWAFLGQFRPVWWPGIHFVTYKLPFEPWKLNLGSFSETRMVHYQCDSCRVLSLNRNCFWAIFDFFVQVMPLLWSGATLWSGNTLLSPKTLTYDHSTKTNWLIVNVTAVKTPAREWVVNNLTDVESPVSAENCFFGCFYAFCPS